MGGIIVLALTKQVHRTFQKKFERKTVGKNVLQPVFCNLSHAGEQNHVTKTDQSHMKLRDSSMKRKSWVKKLFLSNSKWTTKSQIILLPAA